MSTNPDEGGALSPAERDFALRRMPVNDPLVEAYHAANVVPPDLGAPLPAQLNLDAARSAVFELRAVAASLRRWGLEAHAVDLFRIANEIREAVK